MARTENFSVRVTTEERAYLDELAEAERLSLSAAVSLVIQDHMTSGELSPAERRITRPLLRRLRQEWTEPPT